MKLQGLVLTAALLLAPLFWIVPLAAGRDAIALFSQYIGLLALIAMAISQVIATRLAGVELVFGPMDQSYRLHKCLGIGAMVAILLHDTIDAEMRSLGRGTALNEVAETAGEISLYGLLILVVITVATFIPYHLWKWTHRFIGIFFVMGAFHYLFIQKPFSNTDPLGLYCGAICVLGLLAYLYTSAPRRMRPSRRYEITRLRSEGSALAVEMTPRGKPLKHRAGQFAFFAFSGAGLAEPHPFTIRSAPRSDGALGVTVAPLGDLTNRVTRTLKEGQDLRVDGPYGHFGRVSEGPQLWIAAGVGITPFVALAEALPAQIAPVTLVYCLRDRKDAAHLAQLQALASEKPNLDLVIWESAAQGRFSAQAAGSRLGDLSAYHVLFCGPAEMRRALAKGFAALGVSPRRFHFEEFEIRTGLGFKRFYKRLTR